MRSFRDASINIKVLIPPAILTLALGIVSIMAVYGLNEQHATLDAVNDIALEKLALIDEFTVLSERVQSDVLHISVLHFMGLPEREIQPLHARLEQGLNDLNVIYGQILYKWPLDETERTILERMEGPLHAFRGQALQAARVVSDNPSFGVLLVRSSTVSFGEFRDTLAEFQTYQENKIDRAKTESNRQATTLGAAIIGVALLVTLGGVFSTVLIGARLISRPIRSMTDSMRLLADGDLSITVRELERGDEIGAMARTLEVFRDNAIEKAQAEAKLKEYSEQLEDMVEERTHELQEAQEQLVRREKLAALGQLAGGVGHELRNPLGAIKNAAYFLDMALPEPEPDVRETLDILNKEVETSEKIISSLLDYARAKPPTRRKVDVNHVIQEALARITVPQNVEIVIKLDAALPTILADPDQLAQVFGNLTLNAIQALTLPSAVGTPNDGQLTIQTLAGSVGPSLISSPGWVSVSFSDTGVGIPAENLDKLFEPLFTTKAKGIGLGLAIVKTLVEGHEGKIEVESQVSQGSTFRVTLPGTRPVALPDPAEGEKTT